MEGKNTEGGTQEEGVRLPEEEKRVRVEGKKCKEGGRQDEGVRLLMEEYKWKARSQKEGHRRKESGY